MYVLLLVSELRWQCHNHVTDSRTNVMSQDILFDKLSVYEHLKLFAGIKGLPPARQEDEITNLIAEVGLQVRRSQQLSLGSLLMMLLTCIPSRRSTQEKTHSEAASLSGGQKRRLSVAIALIGDPQVVFLDGANVIPMGARRGCDLTLLLRQQNQPLAWILVRDVRFGSF